MTKLSFVRTHRLGAISLLLMLVAGCSALQSSKPQPFFYALDSTGITAATRAPTPASTTLSTLVVNPPHAASGFDSQRIIYVREKHQLEYFSHSEWVDTPARMLAPLIAAAIGNSGAFRAVVLTPSAAAGDLRLDTEIVRLQHDLRTQPSQVRFTLRAHLVENATRRVLTWREFDTVVPAASANPYGGVVAANQAVKTVLENLSTFCAEAVRKAPMAK